MADANFIGSCIACRFFVAPQGAFGVCRRYPSFQNVHQNDWCGEFQEAAVKLTAEEKAQRFNEITKASLKMIADDYNERQKSKRGRKPKVQE